MDGLGLWPVPSARAPPPAFLFPKPTMSKSRSVEPAAADLGSEAPQEETPRQDGAVSTSPLPPCQSRRCRKANRSSTTRSTVAKRKPANAGTASRTAPFKSPDRRRKKPVKETKTPSPGADHADFLNSRPKRRGSAVWLISPRNASQNRSEAVLMRRAGTVPPPRSRYVSSLRYGRKRL